MAHIILLGDSIFDNAAYVPDDLPVIDLLKNVLPQGDQVTLLAVDGDSIQDIDSQIQRLPKDASHLFISVGGNDTLQYGSILVQSSQSSPKMLDAIATMKAEFDRNYQQILDAVLSLDKPTVLCTIYDQCPLLDPAMGLLEFTALSMFNDCITRQAVQAGLPLIDLRVICNEVTDYSTVSPIEPSMAGGQKIARAIATVMTEHNFSERRTVVYGSARSSEI